MFELVEMSFARTLVYQKSAYLLNVLASTDVLFHSTGVHARKEPTNEGLPRTNMMLINNLQF